MYLISHLNITLISILQIKMRLIKLNTVASTNDFLKELSKSESLPDYTTVIAENQTKGRGQFGASWQSESGKNLILSLFVKDLNLPVGQVYSLTVCVATAVANSLIKLNVPDVSIKWPNDIMSDNKKLGGILIENSFRGTEVDQSVIGIGLNVNQTAFHDLPHASSLKVICDADFDIDSIRNAITASIKENIGMLRSGKSGKIWDEYKSLLFKKDVETQFTADGNSFMGIISDVTEEGLLEVAVESEGIKRFSLKQVTMIY